MSETEDLIEAQGTKKSIWASTKSHFLEEIDEAWTDLILLVSCAVSGLIDSAVYNVFTCFVSMQTGNTVYVGLGLSGQPADSPYRWAKSLNAIICFCIGNYFFSRVTRLMNPTRRSTMLFSWLLQAILIFVSAALVSSNVIPPGAADGKSLDPIILLPLGLLSFQSAGQIVQSRLLAFNELPTVVLTSTYCDLMLDPQLFTAPPLRNPKRDRRFVSVIALLLGAAAGGYLTKDGSIALALWIAGGAKVACSICWLFWKSKGSIRLE